MVLRLVLLAVAVSLTAGQILVDQNCTVLGPMSGNMHTSPLFAPSAFGCKDKLTLDECRQLFNSAMSGYEPPRKAGDPAIIRPLECYMSTSQGDQLSEEKKMLAIFNCPNYCGFCCQISQG